MNKTVTIKFNSEEDKLKSINFIKDNQEQINKLFQITLLNNSNILDFKIEKFISVTDLHNNDHSIYFKCIEIPKQLIIFILWLAVKNNATVFINNEKYDYIINKKYDKNAKILVNGKSKSVVQVSQQGIYYFENLINDKPFLKRIVDMLTMQNKSYKNIINEINIINKLWKNNVK